ncbi:MAG: 5'-methylthioadenosine/adenosylhomocysteine nucleosidase [Odoribacter sp.]
MIGIIVAMGVEFRLVEALLKDKKENQINGLCFVEGYFGNKQIVLMQCGIGKVCAAAGTVEMIRAYTLDCIINSGVAGGIDEILRVMDIVVAKEVVYHDVWCGEGNEMGQVQGLPPRFCVDERLYQIAVSLKSDVALYGGLICSGDQFITNRSALEVIKKKFPDGLAVDMESGAIAQVCYMYHIPFLSCRIISDTPGKLENHALQYKDFWEAAPEKSFEILKQLIENI